MPTKNEIWDIVNAIADLFEEYELPEQAKGLRRKAKEYEPVDLARECPCGRTTAGCEYHDPRLQKEAR